MASIKFRLRPLIPPLALIAACGVVVFWSVKPAPLPAAPAGARVGAVVVAAPVKLLLRPASSIFESARADTAIVLAANADPFAPRAWTQKQPAALPRVEQSITPVMLPAAPQAPPPVSAPVLPFKYMGQMEDAGQTIIYLSRGEQTVVARVGEVLDQQYKITAITPAAVEFEITATGAKLPLSIPVSQ